MGVVGGMPYDHVMRKIKVEDLVKVCYMYGVGPRGLKGFFS